MQHGTLASCPLFLMKIWVVTLIGYLWLLPLERFPVISRVPLYAKNVRIVMISDTHGKGRNILIPLGDVLIHCGDLAHLGSFAEFRKEIEWFKTLPHAFKIIIPGNHDVCLENLMNQNLEAQLRRMLRPIIFLRDSGITIQGVKFWGSPWIPPYAGAYNLPRVELKAKWNMIPEVDVLVTHGPPNGILDGGAGCIYLTEAVQQRIKPRVHCFGHVHACAGHAAANGTEFFNVAATPQCYSLEAHYA